VRRFTGALLAGLLVAGCCFLPAAPAAAADCVTNGNPSPAVPWAVQRLNPRGVWPQTRGLGVKVAVIDSGVNAHHPQLTGRVVAGGDLIPGDSSGALTDCIGHGTVVAGIIAGGGVNGTGVVGMAPDATIISIKTLNNLTLEQGLEPRIATAIRTAVGLGAKVINMSLTTTNDDPSLRAAVAYAEENDVVVVAAGGNLNGQRNPVQYPAAYPGVLAVAAIKQDGTHASFSESGPYISVAAPGENIVGPSGSGTGYVITTSEQGGENGGTSYAAPYVSGLAALIRAYYPKLTAPQVIKRITSTTDGAGSSRSNELGFGVINPYQAVNALLADGAPATRKPEALAAPTNPGDEYGITRTIALVVAGAVLLAGLLTVVGAYVIPRGRARGWRPGRLTVVASSTGKPAPKP
jgi:membrane-anchored mycosin MYCP